MLLSGVKSAVFTGRSLQDGSPAGLGIRNRPARNTPQQVSAKEKSTSTDTSFRVPLVTPALSSGVSRLVYCGTAEFSRTANVENLHRALFFFLGL